MNECSDDSVVPETHQINTPITNGKKWTRNGIQLCDSVVLSQKCPSSAYSPLESWVRVILNFSMWKPTDIHFWHHLSLAIQMTACIVVTGSLKSLVTINIDRSVYTTHHARPYLISVKVKLHGSSLFHLEQKDAWKLFFFWMRPPYFSLFYVYHLW